jgi:hypothetical protein
MKKLVFLFVFCISCLNSFCQNIGLKNNIEFSENNKINTAVGGGIYLDFDDFSKKLDLIISLNYNQKNCEIPRTRFELPYKRIYFDVGCLYILPISEKTKIKIGASLSYNIINFYYNEIWPSYSTKSNYLGGSLISNIHFQNILKLPVNLDFFVYPSYLTNIHNYESFINRNPIYVKDIILFNAQVGISVKMN